MHAVRQALRAGDYAVAYCKLQPLVEDDEPEAQYYLGWMYHNGYGLAVNDVKAAYWWEKAAGEDNRDAQMALVLLYRQGGEGVKSDLYKASSHLMQAVQSGDDEARLMLSYYLGDQEWNLTARAIELLGNSPDLLGPEAQVSVEKANLRTAPGTGSSVVETVPKGERLRLLATRGQWAHVAYIRKSRFVWVRSDLISVHKKND